MSVTPESARATMTARRAARDAALASEGERVRVALERAVALEPDLTEGAVYLVGSLAWGGFHEGSDVDVGLEGWSPEAADLLRERLERATQRVVDLRRLETLPASFAERIRREGRRLR